MFPLILIPIVAAAAGAGLYFFEKKKKPALGAATPVQISAAPAAVAGAPRFKVGDTVKGIGASWLVIGVVPLAGAAPVYTLLGSTPPFAGVTRAAVPEAMLSL